MSRTISSASGTRVSSSRVWRGSRGGDLAEVGLDGVVDRGRQCVYARIDVAPLRGGVVDRVDREHGVGVVDVVFADRAGAVVVDDGGLVRGEPFLGGDLLFGFVVGVAFGEDLRGDLARWRG